MKKNIIFLLSLMLAFTSCDWELERPGADDVEASLPGALSFKGSILYVDTQLQTKATSEADANYLILITDQDGDEVVRTTVGDVRSSGDKILLDAGKYVLEARSIQDDIPVAAFEKPVYSARKEFTITAGSETSVGVLVCSLIQTKVTVSYDEGFLSMVTGDCNARVTVTPDSPLDYALNYNEGTPSYDQSAGYFSLSSGTVTMEVVFSGSIEGKSQKMTKVFTDIQKRTWHQVKFVKKVSTEGNADFSIIIDDFIEDEEIGNDMTVSETVIGDDPKAPAGDGGILLESTCAFDISNDIAVPAEGEPFVLTMKATVPGKVKKFTVEINSTNPVFVNAVGDINDGSNVLDLVNPSDGAKSVFTSILPFPYGEAVYDKTEIPFDLSDAQVPLLAFAGTHTFVMHVTDQNGCRKDVSIRIVVE